MINDAYLNPSSIERYILLNSIHNPAGHFHLSYEEWTMRRINKILGLYDIDWFKDKKILVLGDGLGIIGGFFANLGAKVISLEIRKLNVNIAKLINKDLPNFKIHEFDVNNANLISFGDFDLIICWGLIEVLDKSEDMLLNCMKMANLIFLETIITDSDSLEKQNRVKRKNYNDSNFNCVAVIPSVKYIESLFKENKFKINRYDDSDLNTSCHNYNWPARNDGSCKEGKRRFWIFEKQHDN